MKKFDWKSYLHFPKKDRSVIWIIIVVIAGATAASIFWKSKDETAVTHTFVQSLTDSAKNITARQPESDSPYNNNSNGNHIINDNLFEFDPNTLDENGWRQLGLSEKNIHTIINYRNKGGRFVKPEDIKKIYGISTANAERLIPYIRIEAGNHPYSGGYRTNDAGDYGDNYSSKKISEIDINAATEEEWKNLPGIGDVLSKRIMKYRNTKGGFKSVDEVAKTYGISDTEFARIRPYLTMSENVTTAVPPQTTTAQTIQPKININTATEDEMRASRAIPYNVVKAIIIYREQHNGFKSVNELKKIPFITDEMYNKMEPKLTVE